MAKPEQPISAPLGDAALIVRIAPRHSADALDAVLSARERLAAAAIPGVTELASAYETVAVFYDPAAVARSEGASPFEALSRDIERVLRGLDSGGESTEPGTVEIPVCYGGEFGSDLAEVAQRAQLTEAEVIERHCGAVYRVSCIGFTPGFPYLTGLPAELTTRRRTTPRTQVPAGSIGIGGSQTGIYPVSSPGGWNIIGRTPLKLFSVEREQPALLAAGDYVRFRPIAAEEFRAWAG